jgi:hypothetical protein
MKIFPSGPVLQDSVLLRVTSHVKNKYPDKRYARGYGVGPRDFSWYQEKS